MSQEGTPFVRAQSEEEGYNSTHIALLHAFKTHSVLSVDEIKPIIAYIITAHSSSLSLSDPRHPNPPLTNLTDPDRPWTEGDVTQPYLTSMIQTVNSKIAFFDYEIRSSRDQISKELVYALVNNSSDDPTQLATTFTASEIAYIRRVLDYMFDTNNTPIRQVMAIKHTEASQLARLSKRNRQSQAHGRQSQINGDADNTQSATADTGMSITEADAVLDALVSSAFFQKSNTGYYSLAPRALMELRAYLKETYNEAADENEDGHEVVRIKDCEGCREIVTRGIRCNNRECGVRWHDACANSYYRGQRQKKCPRCKTDCTGDLFVGERADRPSGRTSTESNRRSTQRVEEVEEEEEQDDDMEDE
jgi:hypothetical protein